MKLLEFEYLNLALKHIKSEIALDLMIEIANKNDEIPTEDMLSGAMNADVNSVKVASYINSSVTAILSLAQIVPDPEYASIVDIGVMVRSCEKGCDPEELLIAGLYSNNGKIAMHSPMADAMKGERTGQTIRFNTPDGMVTRELISLRLGVVPYLKKWIPIFADKANKKYSFLKDKILLQPDDLSLPYMIESLLYELQFVKQICSDYRQVEFPRWVPNAMKKLVTELNYRGIGALPFRELPYVSEVLH